MEYIHPKLVLKANEGFVLMRQARAAVEQMRAITRGAARPLTLLQARELDARLAEVEKILDRFHELPWLIKFNRFLAENDIARSTFWHWHAQGRITAPPSVFIEACRYVPVLAARAWIDSLSEAHSIARRHLRDRGGSGAPAAPSGPIQPHLGQAGPPG